MNQEEFKCSDLTEATDDVSGLWIKISAGSSGEFNDPA